MGRRKRRKFTDEFKAETVRLIRETGRSITAVAREMDLTPSAVERWVKQAEIDEGGGPAGALTTGEREELRRLRREILEVRMEREILKKAAAFFAKESS
jgi:transposase